jgi:hypothetical protein
MTRSQTNGKGLEVVMPSDTELLAEIRDLLQVMAEPALAKRDAKRRATLRGLVGGSEKRAKAVELMDGSQAQVAIAKTSKLDKSDLSKLVKGLTDAQLVALDGKNPRLLIKLPPSFFDEDESDE